MKDMLHIHVRILPMMGMSSLYIHVLMGTLISIGVFSLITYYNGNNIVTPIDKSAIISIITHFFKLKTVALGTVMICD